MWLPGQQARLDEITAEVQKLYNKDLSTAQTKRLQRLLDEGEQLLTEQRTYKSAQRYAGSASPYENGDPADPLIPTESPTQKSFAGLGRSKPKWQPPSPLQASHTELKQLYDAACHRAGGFQIELGTKAYGQGSDIGMKTASVPIAETGGGFTLPSTIMPGLQMLLPYEPDRLFSHFNGINMDGPSAAFLQHTGNNAPAGVVAEGAAKPDVGMQLAEQTVKPVKIAALASVTLEALQDYQSFVDWIPLELTRALINAETAEVVSGSRRAPHMPSRRAAY